LDRLSRKAVGVGLSAAGRARAVTLEIAQSCEFGSGRGKTWWEMNEEEHRAIPGDFEAQASIGRLPAHNREHLSQGDVAVAMLRRRLEEAVRDVAEGRNPVGVNFSKEAPPLQISAHGMIPYQRAV